jgi:excisionase family DNA binding protein
MEFEHARWGVGVDEGAAGVGGFVGDQWYSPREVGARLGVSRRWVNLIIARGDLPAVELGRTRRVLGADVNRYLREHRRQGLAAHADPIPRVAG